MTEGQNIYLALFIAVLPNEDVYQLTASNSGLNPFPRFPPPPPPPILTLAECMIPDVELYIQQRYATVSRWFSLFPSN